MAVLPDWNSIESTARWSDFLFWAGIVCLVLLAVTEVASHIYGSRSASLSREAASAAGTNRKQEEDAAEKHHAEELDRMQRQLAEAKTAAEEAQGPATKAQQQIATRRLTPAQKQTLIAALTPFAGQKVDVFCIMGDVEGKQFARDLDDVFRAANWDDGGGTGINQATYGADDPVGIKVSVNPQDTSSDRVPPALGMLIGTLVNTGILKEKNVFVNPQSNIGRITFLVGRKP